MSNDLTPPIPPIAASLHDKFLNSHCSSCFLPLPSCSSSTSFYSSSTNPLLTCSFCSASFQYCSPDCASADSGLHISTGECRLFILRPLSPNGDTADVRVALRLLHLFEHLGLLRSSSPHLDSSRRIGGLLASGVSEVMDEGGELAERIREGAALMSQARNSILVGGCSLEEVLWTVMTNAVEVEIGEFGRIGVAVYGPWFSWFNHSCVPNACYHFEYSSVLELSRPCDLGLFKILPAGCAREALDMKLWNYAESSLSHGLCLFGPRIIIRSVKPLKKNDIVCIAYTDLLQPKVLRHIDLWSRYRFVCHCERCCISPQMHADHILNCDARSFNVENCCYIDSEWMNVSDYLEEIIAEYMLDGNPEKCCKNLENLLCDSFHHTSSDDASELRFRLHPFHFLSLKAYIVLSSTYTIQASNIDFVDLSFSDISKNFKIARTAVASSLLIACAIHHLFMSETSIIQNAALFWIDAGASILYLIRVARFLGQFIGSSISLTCIGSHFTIENGQSKSPEDLLAVSSQFIDSISHILINLWPFVSQGNSYLECIDNPAKFSWPQIRNNYQSSDGSCEGDKHLAKNLEWNELTQLAVYCLMYGRYLANICHGSKSHLSQKAGDLERLLKETVL